tara:strand:- start:276 stop:425 length:150 start_codon:yes stop_codon:yes gene_type:complete
MKALIKKEVALIHKDIVDMDHYNRNFDNIDIAKDKQGYLGVQSSKYPAL